MSLRITDITEYAAFHLGLLLSPRITDVSYQVGFKKSFCDLQFFFGMYDEILLNFRLFFFKE